MVHSALTAALETCHENYFFTEQLMYYVSTDVLLNGNTTHWSIYINSVYFHVLCI